jgi:hypothetical protein
MCKETTLVGVFRSIETGRFFNVPLVEDESGNLITAATDEQWEEHGNEPLLFKGVAEGL